MIHKKAVLSLILVAVSAGCQRPAPQTRLSKLPSATDVFNLRTKCAKLGQELDDEMIHGSAISRDTLSNYSIKENRCYVTLNDLDGGPSRWHSLRGLYDGQTEELLASAEETNHNKSTEHGIIFTDSTIDTLSDCHEGGDCGYAKADAYIDSKMNREE
jgi:hypothetical protein